MRKEDSQLLKFCELVTGNRDDDDKTPEAAAISRYLRQCDELDKRAQTLKEIKAKEREALEAKQRHEDAVNEILSRLK